MTPFHLNDRQLAEEQEDNDMSAEFLVLAGVSLAATFAAFNGDLSLVCIPGAMLAALVALLKSTEEKRGWPEKAANSIGISFFGSTLPSASMKWLWPEAWQSMVWQTWAILGFVGGMIGWPIAYAFVKVAGLRGEKFALRTWKKGERMIVDDESKSGGQK